MHDLHIKRILHWRVYAGAPFGVQIRFNPQAFTLWVGTHQNARLDRVEYLRVDEFEAGGSDLRRFPFLKREAFLTTRISVQQQCSHSLHRSG
jgi:hypothetical protein